MICGSGGPEGGKVGSLKRRARSHLAKWKMKNCTPLWREAHFEVKMHKTPQLRATFKSWTVEKVHAVVARSTFRSQNVQNTPAPDHFWKLRCRKSARRCGAKHISKSKCTKHTSSGPLLEAEMSKKCTPLWREAHFQVKMYKTHEGFGPLLEIEMSKRCTPLWREAHFEVKMWNTPGVRTTFGGSDVVARGRRKGMCTLSKVRKREGFVAFSTTSTTTPHYTPIHYTTTPSLHSITLHYTPLHSTRLHYATLHSITLNYIQLHSITLHYTTFHYTTIHYITLHSTTLHYITLHNTTFYITLHYITLHYTPLHYITLHYTTFHDTTLHSTTLH